MAEPASTRGRAGADGPARCAWATSAPEYLAYHDLEWGRPVAGDAALYERLTLEAFQAGLSWITILRKREAFRRAFSGFDPAVVASYDDGDVARLLADPAIVRNRAKILAAVSNARAVLGLPEGLTAVLWSFAPEQQRTPLGPEDVPATAPEAIAMSQELKRRGFRFVGPTTAYSLMQATGMVNDHVAACWVRDEVAGLARPGLAPGAEG